MEKQDKINLFKKVVEANVSAFYNLTSMRAEEQAILNISKRDLTENEIRERAKDFFASLLSRELNERVTRQYDK